MEKDIEICETNTEKLFRGYYGVDTFIEKAAIPKAYGFESKRETGEKGYPDFFKDMTSFAIVVEAKALKHDMAEKEVQIYMKKNKIYKDIVGIAISGQSESSLKLTYYFKAYSKTEIVELSIKDSQGLLF